MSDLGRLFRLSVAGPKPLENFTSTALAIAISHDQRPMVEALGRVDRKRYKGGACPVLDHFSTARTARPSIGAEVQKTLFPAGELPIGYLDLVLSVRDTAGQESAIWVEVKVDAWESGDQIPVYLGHAERLSPRPDVITLGRTEITDKVPFLRWLDVVDAIESISNPHYTWVSLREFLLEYKIVRPRIPVMPVDAAACIDVIAEVNERIGVHCRERGRTSRGPRPRSVKCWHESQMQNSSHPPDRWSSGSRRLTGCGSGVSASPSRRTTVEFVWIRGKFWRTRSDSLTIGHASPIKSKYWNEYSRQASGRHMTRSCNGSMRA